MLKLWKIEPDGRPIFVLCLLFFLGMWVSKTVHPLWFEQNNALPLFGLSYSVMALAGTTSFLLGPAAARLGLRHSMLLGCGLYTLGLLLRAFPFPAPAILSGILSGVGASLALLCIRLWVFEWSGESERARILSYTTLSGHLVRGVGILAIGGAIGALGGQQVLVVVLCCAAALPFAGAVLVARHLPSTGPVSHRKEKTTLTSNQRTIAYVLVLNALFTGLLSSFILPYLPVLITRLGFQSGTAIMLVGLVSISIVLSQPVVNRLIETRGAFATYLMSFTACAVTVVCLDMPRSIALLAFVLAAFGITSNARYLSEKNIEMSAIHRDHAGAVMGWLQSAFLLGDSLGGGLAGIAWVSKQPEAFLGWVAMGLLLTGFLFAATISMPRLERSR